HRDPHASASSALGVHRSTSGRPHRPLLGSLPYAAFARSLPIALHPQLTIPRTPSWNRWFLRGGFYPMAAGLSRPPSSAPVGLEEYFFHGSNTHPNTHDTVPCVPPQPRRRGQGDDGAIARGGGARRADTGTCWGVGESPSRRHRAVRAGGTSGRRIRRRPGGGGSGRGGRCRGPAAGLAPADLTAHRRPGQPTPAALGCGAGG